jgi:hypothetical protein
VKLSTAPVSRRPKRRANKPKVKEVLATKRHKSHKRDVDDGKEQVRKREAQTVKQLTRFA